ncbi:MAG: hypothetical protein JNJ54_29230 [Myxococcaceae bacterium]|nr:hypothetical protein [Myxococcaceae bacterium]
MRQEDRRDAGVLGLVLLALAFVVTPLLHQVDHGHEHHHGPVAPGAPHGAGSLEHQLAAFTGPAEAAQPVFFAVALPRQVELAGPAPRTAPRFSVAQPQGP